MLQKKSAGGGLYDPMIIPRVKQYLEENVHQTYVDVGVMARELQDRYREYTRRKAVPFRMLVEQAYKTVLHSYGLDSNPSSENEEDGNSDLEVMEDGAGNNANHMNDTLTNMYMNNKNKASSGTGAAGGGNDGEAIDISSDEDDEGGNSRDKEKAVSTTSDRMKLIETQIASNKHITVTKVTRAEKPRSGDEAVDSSNGSTNGPRKASEPILLQQAKRRRLEQGNLAQNSEISNSSNPLLQHLQPVVHAQPRPVSQNGKSVAPRQESGPSHARSKRFKKEVCARFIETNFDDIGGMDRILRELCELLLHVKHPEVYRHIGLPPPRGFLLHGPPGSGKTLLAQAIAGQLKIGLIEIPATELVAGVSGESEERIREVFEQAAVLSPCVLFIDEIDAISANRINAQKDMERRIVAQLLSSLDGLSRMEGGDGVLVIGATNRPDALDPALRRVGRFDQEISLGIPDREARAQILKIICRNLKIQQTIDYDELAKLTPGYVGADLLALATRAATTAIKRMLTEHEQQEMIAEARRQAEIEAYRRKKQAEVLSRKDEDDDDVAIMEVEDIPRPATVTQGNLNGDVSTDDVVALEDDIEEVVNLDDDKDEAPEAKEAEKKESEVVMKDSEVEVEKVDAEKSSEEPNKVTEESKKNDEAKEAEMAVAEKEADDKKVEETPADSAEAKPAEVEKMDDSEAKEATTEDPITKEAEKQSDEAKPVEIDDDIEMVADSSTSGDKVETQEAKSTTDIVEKAPAETSEAEEKAEVVVEESEKAKEVEGTVDEQMEPETVVDVPFQLPHAVLTLDKLLNLLLDHSSPLQDEELYNLCIERDDFIQSLKSVQPSAKREGFITVPDVTWNDIGSLGDIREELKLAILAPVKFPHRLKLLGLNTPSGVLLCGPPGCGKTLLAKAVANEAGINFISVKGPELLNMYVGESERAVRQCFQRARNSAPCVIFFDEFDSLCPKRSDSGEGGAGTRVVNQLLTEMDGIEDRKGVFLMAATNRPDIVDPAVLRPGRLDKILYVGLPAEVDRVDILRALTKNRTQPSLAEDVDLSTIARLTEGYTGADLAGLVRQASLQTLKDSIAACSSEDNSSAEAEEQLTVGLVHFQAAIRNIKPSVNEEDKKHYERLKLKYGTPAAQ
ncbi:nuclear valosin-containing protein-like [Topomyia yanbarensis]|uniref:nuclear valosin-containing protein-like n=1 Tax=Topomyia yanbarensis TaxID=2498891 RepID=UPI00273CEC8B|nr:nuclear valosin-containing protein-like [Topomyia yanbarensis]XP_058828936.1 nuclear valosin-containing protein-like [Topomyia yanbarensis]